MIGRAKRPPETEVGLEEPNLHTPWTGVRARSTDTDAGGGHIGNMGASEDAAPEAMVRGPV